MDPTISYYRHSFLKLLDTSMIVEMEAETRRWVPSAVAQPINATVPPYCRTPSPLEDREMQRWITEELNVRLD